MAGIMYLTPRTVMIAYEDPQGNFAGAVGFSAKVTCLDHGYVKIEYPNGIIDIEEIGADVKWFLGRG